MLLELWTGMSKVSGSMLPYAYQFPFDSESDGVSYSFDEEISPSLYPDLKIKIADLLP